MAQVLWLTSSGRELWRKTKGVWNAGGELDASHCIVLTDLPEEAFADIAVPRLFGGDRSAFVERQLAARFPDSKYRAILPTVPGGGVLERLAPSRQSLFAVESNDRVDEAVTSAGESLAGVWPLSAILVGLARSLRLPANLLIAAMQDGGTRIVYVAQGRPQLTRLVHSANTHEAVENELIRTIRHLENTKVVERDGSPLALWVLGSAEPTTADSSKDRLKLVRQDGPEWIQLVLNAVTRMPAVQLASIDQRAVFIAAKLRKQINVAIIAVGFVTTGFTLVQLIDWFETRLRVQQIDSQVAQLVADSASAQERIASYSVSPQLVRQALELDAREVEHAPDMGSHLKVLAQAVTQASGVRLTALEWTYVPAGQLPCTGSTQSPTTPQTSPPAGDVTTGNGPKVEMKFKTKPPAGWTLQKQEYEWAQFSKRLQANLGYTVASDPIALGRVGTLSIDATKHGNEDVTKEWCLVIDPSAKATKDQMQ